MVSNDTVRDLGVLVDNRLKFHEQVSTVTKKANRVLAIVHKSFEYMGNGTFANLYKSLVRPVLEYANIVWGPHYILDQRSIEKVQRRATKLIHGLHNMDYSDRLATLNLPSLKYRRLRGDMITVYMLIHNKFTIDSSDFFTAATTSTTREHSLKLFKPSASTRVRSDFLSSRSVDHWNRLPNHIVNASSINNFKKLLDDHWTDILYNYI